VIDKRANEMLHLYVIVLYPLELSTNDVQRNPSIDSITTEIKNRSISFSCVSCQSIRVFRESTVLSRKDTRKVFFNTFAFDVHGQVVLLHFDDESIVDDDDDNEEEQKVSSLALVDKMFIIRILHRFSSGLMPTNIVTFPFIHHI
jgi:hypothetical protein